MRNLSRKIFLKTFKRLRLTLGTSIFLSSSSGAAISLELTLSKQFRSQENQWIIKNLYVLDDLDSLDVPTFREDPYRGIKYFADFS